MASIIIAALLLLARRGSASNLDSFNRTHGFCKQLDIPVFATADSAVYDIPRVNSNTDAIAWAIHEDTWSTPAYVERLIKKTTTSGTFNIHGQLCVPKSGNKKDILQIATHGVHYDSKYWDPTLDRENQSFVEAVLRQGYSIFTYDRLGVGKSDKPDAYEVVQAPLEVEILRQLTLMARNGTLYNFAKKRKPSVSAFNKQRKPTKVVHYGELTDGAIITGYVLNQCLGKSGMASWAVDYATTSDPPFKRTSGYVVCKKSGIQTIFFPGNPDTAYTDGMLEYGDAIKQPVPVGELASAYRVLGLPGPSLKAPVQYMLAEFDFYIRGGDCKGIFNATSANLTYPNAAAIEAYIQPNTGHAFPLHNNATAGYQVTFDFLTRHGL